MNRRELEHVIRAAAAITGDREIVVVGSQAILGQFPNAPPELLLSREADVYPRNHPERAELIEVIGELSPFHTTFGYYADGISAELPTLPDGWRERLVAVPVGDVVLSKWAAGREKDLDFVQAAVRHRLVERETLLERLETMSLEPSLRAALRLKIEASYTRPLDRLSTARPPWEPGRDPESSGGRSR